MKEYEIKEGDIVEIDYINEFTKEHINEGKALVMWKGVTQPLVHKLSTKNTVWTCYEYIARVVGHVDIERYMENAMALEQEPCNDCISRQAALDIVNNPLNIRLDEIIKKLPPVMPQPKTECSCEQIKWERDMAIAQLKELGYGLGEKPKTDVLDKIRAEIERLHYHPKLDFIKNDEVVEMALEIIDKYRESEE